MEFWYRKKYGLPATDPRFLSASVDEMLADYWAYHYADNPNAQDEVVDDDFDLQAELARIEAEGEAELAAALAADDFEEISKL